MRSTFLASFLLLTACEGVFGAPPKSAYTSRSLANAQDRNASADAPAIAAPQQGADGRFVCDDKIYPVRVDGHRLTVMQYQNAIRDLFGGAVSASANYPGPFGKSQTGYSTEADLNAMSEQGTERAMVAAEDVAEQVAALVPSLLPCATSGDDACAQSFLDGYVQRAFRRPLAADETATLLAVYTDGRASGASFAEAIAFVTAVALQSPQFLYVIEGAATPMRALDGYELASRLSFAFADTIPDAALLQDAAAGKLGDRSTLAAHARRLLADPKSTGALARFFREWTQTVALEATDKDPTVYPAFDATLAQSMNESFDRFVTGELRDAGTLQTLLTSSELPIDAALAAHYGVAAPAAGFVTTALDPQRFDGLVTHPALLASLAHTNSSSYVFRGRFIRKRLLCDVIAPPPPNAMAEFATITLPQDPTGKDVSASVNARAGCTGCHSLMDPGGLALEHFDGMGKYRDSYASGKAIDPSGVLPAVGDHTLAFADHRALADALAKEPLVATCFQRQLVRFTVSRTDDAEDACAVQALGDALAANGGKLEEAFVALTQTDAFSYRVD
jgi:hypothetical protein